MLWTLGFSLKIHAGMLWTLGFSLKIRAQADPDVRLYPRHPSEAGRNPTQSDFSLKDLRPG